MENPVVDSVNWWSVTLIGGLGGGVSGAGSSREGTVGGA